MRAKIEEIGKLIETDVLVVGGGIAGAFAAIAAREYPVEVTLVDKSSFGRSGCSALASGVWHCYLPGDDLDLWYKDRVGGGVPQIDPRLLKKRIIETAKITKMMDEWGVKWVKEGGKFARSKGTGDTVPRSAMLAEGGPQMMLAVRNRALKRGVNVVNRVMITDLLTSDGRHPTKGKIIGAIGFHSQTGAVYVFNAKATILAAGGTKGLPYARAGQPGDNGMPRSLSGDAEAMAFRLGADLINMEVNLEVNGLQMRGFTCAPSMNLLFGLGAKFTNRLGERFMERYDPIRKESAVRWVTSLAVSTEIREGRGPVTLDCTHFSSDQIKLCNSVIPIIMDTLEKGGYDITKDKIVYEPNWPPNSISGKCGARTNEHGETSIEGLYAAGGCTVAPLEALLGCSMSGWHAGDTAAEHSLSTGPASIGPEAMQQVERLSADILAPLRIEDGVEFSQVQEGVAEILKKNIGPFLHEERLRMATDKLAEVEEGMPRVRARDCHELVKVLSIRNYAKVLELAVRAARRRTESRKGFVREDYPQTDNVNWLKRILLRRDDDKITFWEEPILAD